MGILTHRATLKNINMKTLTSRLYWILCGLLTCRLSNASTADEKWLSKAEFIQAVSQKNRAETQFLAVSESMGIALLDQQGNVLSHIPTRSEHLDFRWLPNSSYQGVLSTVDINSGNIQLINVDFSQNTLKPALEYSPKNTAIDALCLGVKDKNIELFTVDVKGEAKQMALSTPVAGTWQLNEINRFAVGLNMKACAVSEVTDSLYITEENIGVWR